MAVDPIFGSIISAGASLLGGVMNSKSSAKTQRLQMIQAAQDREMQREFAQNGVRWKVDDARAAGIHPLAALGAQTHSFSPINVGLQADHSMGNAVAQMGQDISRGINATRTSEERTDAVTKTAQDLQLKRMGLENALLASQIAKINQPGSPPPFPGGTPFTSPKNAKAGLDPDLIKEKPMERTPGDPERLHNEPGAITDSGFSRTAKGWAPVPSKDTQERIEDNMISSLTWALRNQMVPSFGAFSKNQVPFPAPEGKEWFYHPIRQEYRLRKVEQPRSLFRRNK